MEPLARGAGAEPSPGPEPSLGPGPCAAVHPRELTDADIAAIQMGRTWYRPDTEPGPMPGPVCAALPPRPTPVTNKPEKNKVPGEEEGPDIPRKPKEQPVR